MRVKAAIALANAEYYKKTHDFKGNAVQLGGMFIFDPTMSRCVFEFREKYAGDSPTLVDVLNSLRTLAPDNESIDSKRISELDGKQKILDLAREAALERSAN